MESTAISTSSLRASLTTQDRDSILKKIDDLRSEMRSGQNRILSAIRQQPANLETKEGASHFLVSPLLKLISMPLFFSKLKLTLYDVA